jgi:adenylate cyclase
VNDTYRFGRFELNPATRQLLAGGEPLTLGARALDVLIALVERRDRVVTKEELLEAAWSGLVVEESNLPVQISALRKLLGSEAIVTVAGRGYRFAAPLAAPDPPPGASADAERSRLAIAVLPFANRGGDADQDYFADGITEDIITELARWRTLAVASRNSTFRFKGQRADPAAVARTLGVQYVVEGSIRRMDDRVRVTAQLTDAVTGRSIWSDRFDRSLADLFAVQDELVNTIVGTLAGRVQASSLDRARRKPPSSMDAYDLVLRGNALNWDEPDSAEEAIRNFEHAIAIDPAYGLAHSLLAVVLRRRWEHDLTASIASLDRPMALAQRAVELAEDESTCHTILGQIYLDRRQFDLALHHTRHGAELNRANQWNRADLGNVLAYVGRAAEGLALLQEARRVDPYFGPGWYWRSVGIAEFVLGRYGDALADLERGMKGDPAVGLALIAACHAQLGDRSRARAALDRCLARHAPASIGRLLERLPFREARDTRHVAESFRLAGLPE